MAPRRGAGEGREGEEGCDRRQSEKSDIQRRPSSKLVVVVLIGPCD